MKTFGVYPVDVIMELLRSGKNGRGLFPRNAKLKHSSHRMKLFMVKGLDCVSCDTVGAFFRLESHAEDTPHFNLYGVNAMGEVRLMTKDHIVPKSKGGANILENYQPMCETCNGAKGDKFLPVA